MDNTGKFYASDNPERFCIGPCETREEAIEQFKAENEGKEPEVIGIGIEKYVSIDGHCLVENLANGSLYDELYEDALSDWCSIEWNDPKWVDLSERLTTTFHKWLDEVGERKSWTVIEETK